MFAEPFYKKVPHLQKLSPLRSRCLLAAGICCAVLSVGCTPHNSSTSVRVKKPSYEVVALEHPAVARAQNFFFFIRNEQWEDAFKFVDIKNKVSRQRFGIGPLDLRDDVKRKVIKALKRVWGKHPPGPVIKANRRVDERYQVQIMYLHGDLDGVRFRYINNQWYYSPGPT